MNQASKNKPSSQNKYLKYSGMAFQMIATILLGLGIGYFLDDYLGTEKIFTAIFTLLFVIASIYLTLKDFIKK
ncbi:MAG: AtpZ/AtpI family protein [Chitinophagales bacterium]|nr:AtpZ/AtpI family protein [Chitinophagales bacterium]